MALEGGLTGLEMCPSVLLLSHLSPATPPLPLVPDIPKSCKFFIHQKESLSLFFALVTFA